MTAPRGADPGMAGGGIVQADPIEQPVIDQVFQLLGYDPAEVVGLTIEPTRVYVLTRASEAHGAEFRHVIL